MQRLDREAVVLADGDQPPLVDERVHLGRGQHAVVVEPHGLARQEEVVRVAVELRPLVGAQRVLDGQLVEAELVAQLVELLGRGPAQVHPHDGAPGRPGARTRRRPGSPRPPACPCGRRGCGPSSAASPQRPTGSRGARGLAGLASAASFAPPHPADHDEARRWPAPPRSPPARCARP